MSKFANVLMNEIVFCISLFRIHQNENNIYKGAFAI